MEEVTAKIKDIADLLEASDHTVVLTGAGVPTSYSNYCLY